MTTKEQQGLHRRACRLLGVDPEKLRLVGPKEYKELEGYGVGSNLGGRAGTKAPVYYVRRGEGLSVYLHECLHILFPSRPHFWVYLAAWKLAGIKEASRAYGYGRAFQVATGERKVEGVEELRRLARLSAQRKGLG